KILAISGSGRAASTNTAMLNAVADISGANFQVTVFSEIATLPVFSPDAESEPLPFAVQSFIDRIRENDGLIISSPEYVRAIPGGLKNAIDWLVSREEIIDKPIMLMHASHRGDDMLAQLRLVLSTVSDRFYGDLFLRFDLMKLTPEEILRVVTAPVNQRSILDLLKRFEKMSATSVFE
ncbi:MAG: NADPH-dependent FMN reductase, partial [Pseudomonadota bacterium]